MRLVPLYVPWWTLCAVFWRRTGVSVHSRFWRSFGRNKAAGPLQKVDAVRSSWRPKYAVLSIVEGLNLSNNTSSRSLAA